MAFIKKQMVEPVLEDERKRERDFPSLLEQLSDPDPVARRWAARDLVNSKGSVHLVERLKVEPEVSVREVILSTLISLGDPEAVEGLAECLRSDDAALRNEVLETMKQMPDEVAPIIQGLLSDDDPDIRIFAVDILESLRHPEVESWLIGVIEKDLHLNVCATAANLLCEVGTEAAVEPLKNLWIRFANEPYICFTVAVALKRIHGS